MFRQRLRACEWCLIGSLALARQAHAEPQDEGEAEGAPAAPPRAPSLIARIGVEPLSALLAAPQLSERLRGIQRLAGLGTPAALQRLLRFAFERKAQLGARECLTLARALAPYAADGETQVALARLMNQRPAASSGHAELELFELARGTAALALGASRSPAALRVLGGALRSGGPGAVLAEQALQAYPPAELDQLLAVPGEPSVQLARLLGVLGDQRAFYPLRAWVRGESAEVRAAAAIALTQLGELETLPLAREWLSSSVPVLRQAAVEILVLAQDPAAARALAEELASERQQGEAVAARALEFPDAVLSKAVPSPLDPGSPEAWTLLGRIGGAAAASQLEQGLRRPETAFAAAHALSRLPGPDGHAALERALDGQQALPLVARAAALRSALWDEHFEALSARLQTLGGSASAAERAVAAWGRSLSSAAGALAELASGDPVRIEAAANNALWFDDEVLAGAAHLLSEAAPGRARSALAFVLLRPSGRRGVTSRVLSELVLEGNAAAPLALRALASRDDPHFDAFAEAYLAHPDPILRCHVARGLGESRRASAIGLLARSYEFESDETVRHALVRGLSQRRGLTVRRALELAAKLDPSPRVRAAARLGLGGVELGDPPRGSEFFWAELRSNVDSTMEPGPGRGASGLLHVAPGLALPVFADPAGILLVAGVSVHPLALRWQ